MDPQHGSKNQIAPSYGGVRIPKTITFSGRTQKDMMLIILQARIKPGPTPPNKEADMFNFTNRSKRHVSVTRNAIRVRELPPAEVGYDVTSEQDLALFHVGHGKVPTQTEIQDMILRAKLNIKNSTVYLPLNADGLMAQRGAVRGRR